MRGADRTARNQIPVFARDRNLTRLSARLMDPRIERRIAAFERIDRHCPGHHGRGKHILGAEQPRQRERCRDLSPVDQRQAFLGAQSQGLQARRPQPVGCGADRPGHAHLADTEQYRAHVGQRCQVPRCAHRALGRNDGIDLVLQQGEQRFDHLHGYPGKAACQCIDLQHEEQPNDRIGQGLSHPRGVREQQIALQQFQLLGRNSSLRQQAEASVDAVGGVADGDDFVHQSGSRANAGAI